MKILYYDCFAGISGDMNIGALIDLGVPFEYLREELMKLHLSGYELKCFPSEKMGINGTKFQVILKDLQQKRKEHSHQSIPSKAFINPQHLITNHEINHEHESHRGLREIKQIISSSSLNNNVKRMSLEIFQKIGEAEAKIHNKDIEEIHFHEVGAIDSMVDIIGAAICIDYLKPDKIIASPVQLGSGMVKCAHGMFPVPAPATAEILKGIPVKTGGTGFESTTPTGAAIIACLSNEFSEKNKFTILKTAYGIGHKNGEIPNVLRVILAEEEVKGNYTLEHLYVAECNIDDMNPELYENIINSLLELGANECFITPVIMKKGRPGQLLSIICKLNLLEKCIDTIYKETTVIGIRYYAVERKILQREVIEFTSSLGSIRIKISRKGNEIMQIKPEYEDCLKISKEKKIPLIEVIKIINNELITKYKLE